MGFECGWSDEDDDEPGPCCLRPRVVAAINIIVFLSLLCTLTYAYTLDLHIDKLHDELQEVHVQEFTLDGGMRPQFFTFNSTGEWSVPSGVYLSGDGKMYSRSWCTFSENTRTARVDFVVQGTAETSSRQLNTGVEFRFEIPYGAPIGSVIGAEGVEYSRCPLPLCGGSDYRAGIGPMGTFTNMESAFFTIGQVTQNRTRIAPTPVSCGCSMEMPTRISCSFSGAQLLDIDGELGVAGTIMYTTITKTQPPAGGTQ